MNNKILYGISLAVLVALVFSVINFVDTHDGQWVCVAKDCVDWATGDQWISDNCRSQGEGADTKLWCKIQVNDEERSYPLEMFNLTNVKSCRKRGCVTQVYARSIKKEVESE